MQENRDIHYKCFLVFEKEIEINIYYHILILLKILFSYF